MLSVSRRFFMGALAAVPMLQSCSSPAEAAVFHDRGCGCCLEWIKKFRADSSYTVTVIERDSRSDLHSRFGLSPQLASCHTAVIDGFAFEGHVPPADIRRFLQERPAGYQGLAVPGMPVGSPGMEQGDVRDHFDVVAFGPVQMAVYASY